MRKLLFVFLLIIITGLPAISNAEYKVAFGYRLGFGVSGMSGNGAPEGASSAFAGAPVGLYLETHLNPHISIMPELSWLKYTIGSDTGDEEFNYHYDYLAIPLIIKFKLMKGDFQPCIFAGPYYALTLGAGYVRVGSLTYHDTMEETNKSNYGFVVGIGYDAYFGGFLFSLDLRRTMGMSNVYSDDSTKATSNSTLFMIGTGWGF